MSPTQSIFFSAALALAGAACTSSSAAAPTGGMHRGMKGESGAHCPLAVANTTVNAEDVEGGAALVFSTTGDVAELRARVGKLAAHHNAMHDGDASKPEGMMMKDVPLSTARTEEVDAGARMILTPKSPDDVEALRAHLRERAVAMKAGQCPMHGSHTNS